MYTGFWIEENAGNNSFSFERRKQILGSEPRIWVPPLLSGTISDLKLGTKIVFEEMDDQGEFQRMTGLQNFIRTEYISPIGKKIPTSIFDNHNHAFYFWHQALAEGMIQKNSQLIHIDAHTDMNAPKQMISAKDSSADIQNIFKYTNFVLNVGNFIVPAIQTRCISPDVVIINSEAALQYFNVKNVMNHIPTMIVDIDLDFWNTDLVDISPETAFKFARELMNRADLITIATSPFFMDQGKALEILRELFRAHH